MLRGHIEQATPAVISGWVHAEGTPLRGRRVLAFLDGACVAVGRVEHFRRDLADAGLGDGWAGFHFPAPAGLAPHELARVVVRLEAGDAVLLQPGARVEGPGPAADPGPLGGPAPPSPVVHPEARLRWLRARGALTELECDFVRVLGRFGVYDHDLGEPVGDAAPHAGLTAPEAAAAALLEAYALGAVAVARREVASLDELAALRGEAGPSLPVLALWCAAEGRVGVAEASHLDRRAAGTPAAAVDALTDYRFGPRRLLVLHRDCRIAPRPRAAGDRIAVFTGAVAEPDASRGAAPGPARGVSPPAGPRGTAAAAAGWG